MRFLATVNRDWTVTVATPAGAGEGWPRTRRMRRLSLGASGSFPAPPTDELPDPGAEHYALCAGGDPALLATAYRRVANRDPQGSIPAFGRYLFECLLGEELWAGIRAAAERTGSSTIELALSWPRSESWLHRLNWEMMRSEAGFLAAGVGGVGVAITRVVAGATAPARRIEEQPRVLFVVGSSLTDPRIRPGAEYLGMLRKLKRDGRTIHARLLEDASPRRIQEAMAAFRPHVVHFICHGNLDPQTGLGYLELAVDEPDLGVDRRRSGEQLLGYLKVAGALPAAVVLSTCFSAGGMGPSRMLGAHETAPLAAELVAGGVPVVLGMAGRVSDLACRLFTRRFGECLVRGDPLVAAAAEARRATFLEAGQPHLSPDWALPAVFLSETVEEDYAPVRPDSGDRSRRIASAITSYRVERGPVFCGRDSFLQAFDELFRGSDTSVLGAFVREQGPGFGRTRLLEELTIQALRDGNVPVLVSPAGGREPPRTLAQLGNALLDAIVIARDAFGLDDPLDSQLILLHGHGPDAARQPGVDAKLGFELRRKGQITPRAVRRAAQLDLAALAADARQHHDSDARVVVLFDEVDEYDEAATILLDELLDGFGLGSAGEPVPVVLTLSLGGTLDHRLRPWVERAPLIPWLVLGELGPFREDGEDMMAYELVLLTPSFNPEPGQRSWVRNPDVTESEQITWEARFRRNLRGMPSALTGDVFDLLVEFASAQRFIVEADDEDRLARLRGDR